MIPNGERGWVERRGGRRRVDFLVRPMSEQKGGEEEPERERERSSRSPSRYLL